jgi:hypothetical protein
MWTIPERAAESNPADGLPAKRRQVYTRLAMTIPKLTRILRSR